MKYLGRYWIQVDGTSTYLKDGDAVSDPKLRGSDGKVPLGWVRNRGPYVVPYKPSDLPESSIVAIGKSIGLSRYLPYPPRCSTVGQVIGWEANDFNKSFRYAIINVYLFLYRIW